MLLYIILYRKYMCELGSEELFDMCIIYMEIVDIVVVECSFEC